MDLILHKLAHEMVFSKLGDEKAIKRFELMKKFHQEYPQVVFVDPLDSVAILTDRFQACQMLVKFKKKKTIKLDYVQIEVPPFKMINSKESFEQFVNELTKNTSDNNNTKQVLNFPLIVKSVEACATDRSHMMSVITKVEDLIEYKGFPTLYQKFINHNGRLFKGYVLGELIQVAERKSLPNLDQFARQVDFDTQEKYPTHQDFCLRSNTSTPKQINSCNSEKKKDKYTQQEIFKIVQEIGEILRKELQLSLFGFDVILEEEKKETNKKTNGRFYVIDVNYFPSYKELEDFDTLLRQHLKKTFKRQSYIKATTNK
jgi:inositol-1,3,4-trisphosphate 5/6-kinase/inositol-tetrakisphosphate 1-kinase